jgi:thioredoxin-like negative regulator of GroEL
MSHPLLTLQDFADRLQKNQSVFIVKLGADWCGPCKQIETLVHSCMIQAPSNVECAIVDVDESFEIYSFLKKTRVINGIPAILAYYAGNTKHIPDDVVIGADQNQIVAFFQRCYKQSEPKLS